MSATDPGSSGRPPVGPWWTWLPLPALAAIMALFWITNPRSTHDAPRLLSLLNLVFSTLVALIIAFVSGQGFLRRREAGQLLLGCGVLSWGLCTSAAALARPALDTYAASTVFNLGAWVFGACQLAGIIAARRGRIAPSPVRWLIVGYASVLLLTILLAVGAGSGWLPFFFFQGQEGTFLRQIVLGSAIGMIFITSGLLWQGNLHKTSPFAYWYSLGLALLGLGMAGVMAQATAGSPLDWLSRSAQYLGSAYLLTGLLAQAWSTHQWDFPLPEAMPNVEGDHGLIGRLQDPSARGLVLRYGLAVLASAAAFGLYQALTSWVGPGLPTYIVFYPGVILVAILAGPGPGMLATVLVVALVDLWVLQPIGTFYIESSVDRLGVVLFTGIGTLLSAFAEFYRRNRRKAAIYDQELVLREMRQDKDFLAEVLEQASQPFAVVQLDGRLGIFNHAFAQLTGYEVEELRTLDWLGSLTPPEWRAPEAAKLNELQRTGLPVRYEKECFTKAGARVPIELLVHLVKAAGGRPDYYYSFLTDITEHKRVEGLLQRYELLARHTRDIVLFVQRESGSILEANTAAEIAYGYSREELLQLSIKELRAPATRIFTEGLMAQADSKGILFETIHQRRDGSTFPVEVSSLGATIAGVRTLLSVIRDSTLRKQWEDALQESEATLRAILDATQESILLFDLDGTILSANRTALQRLGRTSQETLGTHFSRFLGPEMAVAHAARLAEVVETGSVVRYEDEQAGVIFDHTFYPVPDAGGHLHRVASFSRNITEARRSEAALKKTNARIKLLADSARELLSTEDPQGVMESLCHKVMGFLDCQVFFTYIADKEKGELHLNAFAGLSAEEGPRFEWLPCDMVEGGCLEQDFHPSPPDELVNKRKAWTEWLMSLGIHASAHQPLLVEGRVLGLLTFGAKNRPEFSEEELGLMKAVADQVSLAMQRIHSKHVLQDMNAELARTNQKLSLASQELQVVNAELTASNLLLEERVADRTQELQTRMLQLRVLAGQLNRAEEEERQRIAQIIHDHLQQLLVAARLSVDTLSIRAKGEVIENGLQSLYGILTESIQVARSLTAELHPSVLHREGLAAALTWLAGWYKQQHGLSVHVEAHQQAELPDPELRVMLFRAVRELLFNVVKHAGVDSARVRLSHPERDSVLIEVLDEGVGFDTEKVDIGNGSHGGFGLFSLRERMELFGGRLEVQSSPGKGSHFRITAPVTLPALSPHQPEVAPAAIVADPRRQAPERTAKVRILLADDHSVVREGMAQVLKEEADFEVVGQAANGQEALEEARRLLPDLVVMDVSMPVMNGIEATRRILAELPRIKILGLSMFDDESHAQVMREAGAVAFLDKGGPIAILKATIRKHADSVKN